MQKTEQGRLEVEVTDDRGHSVNEEVLILLSENKAQFGKQFRLSSKTGAPLSGEFPPGPYTVQALAKSYDVGREFIEIRAKCAQKAAFRLKKSAERPLLSVAERLEKRYGIKSPKDGLQNLTVAADQKISLDYRQYRDGAHVQVLSAKSLADLKRWVGSPEGIFVGEHPKFGSLPSLQGIGGDRTKLSSDQQVNLSAVAREYIYGNAGAVAAGDLKSIENLFKQLANVYVPIFFYQDVVINNGATLEIGKGSSAFVCNTLTIHHHGTLSVVGDVRADVGTLIQL